MKWKLERKDGEAAETDVTQAWEIIGAAEVHDLTEFILSGEQQV